jgi:hypothetical protein
MTILQAAIIILKMELVSLQLRIITLQTEIIALPRQNRVLQAERTLWQSENHFTPKHSKKMTDTNAIQIPDFIEIAFEIVVLPVTGLVLPVELCTKEEISHDFIPDRRIFTFRLLGKPSPGQSPPQRN